MNGLCHSRSFSVRSLLTLSTNHVSTRRMTKTGKMMPAPSQPSSTSSNIQYTADINPEATPMMRRTRLNAPGACSLNSGRPNTSLTKNAVPALAANRDAMTPWLSPSPTKDNTKIAETG